MNVDGSGRVKLTANIGNWLEDPIFSADGTKILFTEYDNNDLAQVGAIDTRGTDWCERRQSFRAGLQGALCRCIIAAFQHSGSNGLFLRSVCLKNDDREGSPLGETFPLTKHLDSEMSTI